MCHLGWLGLNKGPKHMGLASVPWTAVARIPAGLPAPPEHTGAAVRRPCSKEAANKKRGSGWAWREGENVKPIKPPFTFTAVKLYRDFSTHDMNNNHAFFSGIAKATTPVRPFASRIILGRPAPGRRPPEKEGLGIGQPLSEGASWGPAQLPSRAGARLPPSRQAWSAATPSGRKEITLVSSRNFSTMRLAWGGS